VKEKQRQQHPPRPPRHRHHALLVLPASDDAVEAGGRRAPPLLAAEAAGEEAKSEAEAEAGWDGLGCSPVSECGGSRRTPAPPQLAGWRSAAAGGRGDGRDGLGRRRSSPAYGSYAQAHEAGIFHLPKKFI
jgi:hypothetical protein